MIEVTLSKLTAKRKVWHSARVGKSLADELFAVVYVRGQRESHVGPRQCRRILNRVIGAENAILSVWGQLKV